MKVYILLGMDGLLDFQLSEHSTKQKWIFVYLFRPDVSFVLTGRSKPVTCVYLLAVPAVDVRSVRHCE